MKKLLLLLGLVPSISFGAAAAYDIISTQQKDDGSGSIIRNVTTSAGGLVTLDASRHVAVVPVGTDAQIHISNGTVVVNKTLSGDGTLANTGVFTLATSGVSAGTYGSASATPTITFDAKGRATSVSNTTITGFASSIIYPNVAPASGQIPVGNAGGTAYANITVSGDATLASTGVFTLGTSGVSAGTYGNTTTVPRITFDAKGRATVVSNNTISIPATAISDSTSVGRDVLNAVDQAAARTAIGAGTGGGSISSLTGDVTASGSGAVAATLATSGVSAGTYGSATAVGVVAFDAKGRATSGSNVTITGVNGVPISGSATPILAVTGTTTVSGVNTGDQTITLTGDVTGAGTGSFATTLANSGVSAGTYGNATTVPTITVDAKGRVTTISNTTISVSGGGTKTMRQWTAQDGQPPASNYGNFGTRNSVALISFVAGSNLTMVFVGRIPQGADLSNGISVISSCTATTATTGNYVITTSLERCNTDIDSDSFGTAISVTTTTSGTSGIPTTTTNNHSSSEIDGLTAGDMFRLKWQSSGADGAYTMTGGLELLTLETDSR